MAETLNFRQAAENLHLAQPALSTAIRQLENELGVRLLERTTRSVALTPTGEVFLERARKALAMAEEAFAVGRDAAVGIAGRLRVGASPLARTVVIGPLQSAWATARPGIAVHVTEAPTTQLQVAVGAGELDLAIGWCPTSEPGLRYERLRDLPVRAHVAVDHPLAGEASVTLERLAEETILVGSGEGSRGYSEMLMEMFREEGLSPKTLPNPYPDVGMLAAIEGRAVVVSSVDSADARRDLAVLDVTPPRTMPFELVWRDREPSATLTAILDIARATRDAEGWATPGDDR